MPAAQQDHQQLLDDVLEADNGPAHLADNGLIMLVELLDRLEFVGGRAGCCIYVHGFAMITHQRRESSKWNFTGHAPRDLALYQRTGPENAHELWKSYSIAHNAIRNSR